MLGRLLLRVDRRHVASVCVLAVFLGFNTATSKPKEDPSSGPTTAPTTTTTGVTTAAAPTAAPKPAIEVTAKQLFNDYHANEVNADDQYKGKTLLVSGTVSKIRKDFRDTMILDLATSNQFQPVAAELDDSEKATAKTLSQGDGVKLRCTGKGMVVGRPRLIDCLVE